MPLEDTSVVDCCGIERSSGFAIMTLFDSWSWDDQQAHLLALQNKLNSYLGFIENGQIWESYPIAKGRQIVIDVISRFPIPPIAATFLEKAQTVATELNVIVRHTHAPD